MSGNSITPQNAAILASLTYVSDPEAEMDQYLPGWTIVWNGQQTILGNYGFIATDAANSVYAFAIRGSLPPTDIFKSWDAFANWVIEDLNVLRQAHWTHVAPHTTGAKIACGTNDAFNSVNAMPDSSGTKLSAAAYLVKHAIANNKPVIITGHSLGGNIANVFSSYFVSAVAAPHNFTQTYLYSFAAPAAGNGPYATDLDSKLANAWHYVNNSDIVPHFPFAEGIKHVAGLYSPSPSAVHIDILHEIVTITLQHLLLSLTLLPNIKSYKQQKHNYITFTNPVDTTYDQNTFTDFGQQARVQHSMGVYAAYLHVNIPGEAVVKSAMF